MAKQFAKLQCIDNNRLISEESDYEFWYNLKHALLLALKESGTLNAAQFRLAEERLRELKRSRARKLMEKGDKD